MNTISVISLVLAVAGIVISVCIRTVVFGTSMDA